MNSNDIDILGKIKLLVWVARFIRKLGGSKAVIHAKHYVTLQALLPLHLQAIHKMRKLALDMLDQSSDTPRKSSREAMEVCSALRNTMGNVLDLNVHDLHCSIKVFIPGDRVVTWARSGPLDDRPHEFGEDAARPLTDGTPWCALIGRNDGKTSWRQHKCFSCNDLLRAHERELWVCKRDNWQRYYKSVLVYPLLYRKDADEPETVVFGFLCFDSPKKDAFIGLPDIFDFRETEDWNKYHHLLNTKAPFHLGAILADTLSIFLRPFYEGQMTQDKRNQALLDVTDRDYIR